MSLKRLVAETIDFPRIIIVVGGVRNICPVMPIPDLSYSMIPGLTVQGMLVWDRLRIHLRSTKDHTSIEVVAVT